MKELTFRLTAADLAAYQLAARDRLMTLKPRAWWEKDSIRWLSLMVILGLVFAVLDRLFPAVFGRNLELMELLAGLLIGGAVVFGLVWMTYSDQRRRLARPDGPLLGEQTLRLTNESVVTTTVNVEARYAWPAVEEVTEARGLVLLWIEPGVALAVPAHAFGSSADRRAFICEVEARRGAAGLPRVGSFG